MYPKFIYKTWIILKKYGSVLPIRVLWGIHTERISVFTFQYASNPIVLYAHFISIKNAKSVFSDEPNTYINSPFSFIE